MDGKKKRKKRQDYDGQDHEKEYFCPQLFAKFFSAVLCALCVSAV
jgi:hypothetical protein